MEDAAEVLEDLSGNLAAARHLEVEYHALAGRAVLPEIPGMVLSLFLFCLHSNVGFVGLNVGPGEQIVLHRADDGDQQFAYAQHRIVDRGQRHIDAEIAQEDRALPV